MHRRATSSRTSSATRFPDRRERSTISGDLIDDYQGSVDFFQSIQNMARQYGASPSWNPLAGRQGVLAGQPYLPGDIQPVSQEDAAVCAMLNFGSDTLFGDVSFAGNIGLRYVDTRVGVHGIDRCSERPGAEHHGGLFRPLRRGVPPNSPPNTPPQTPGGVCLRGPAGYAQLQTWATGVTTADTAKHDYNYFPPSLNLRSSG